MSFHDTFIDETPERPHDESTDRGRGDDSPSRPERRSGRHPVNVGHLVMGVAFVGLVIVWALITSDTVELDEARWILPLPWLVAGAIGIVATLLRGRRASGRMQGWHQNSPDSQA